MIARRKPLAEFCAALLLLVAGSAVGQTPVETVEGEFRVLVEDRFDRGIAIEHYALETNTGTVPLEFSTSQAARSIGPGSRIRVSGSRSGGRLRVATSETLASKSAVAVASGAAIGVRRIVMLLLTFRNDPKLPADETTARQTLAILNQYYEEASYGQFSAA